jgi:hypothetical protein
VSRYGRRVTITFTVPDEVRPEELETSVGVDSVAVRAGKATVTGTREAIAQVGALLVASGAVPADLSVRIPRLEDALVDLLEGDVTSRTLDGETQTPGADYEPIGVKQ